MKQHKVERDQIKRSMNEQENGGGILLPIVSLLFLPFLVMHIYIRSRNTSSATWRLFDYYKSAKRWFLPSLIVTLIDLYLVFILLKKGQYQMSILAYLISWITSVAVWICAGIWQLQGVASDVSKGIFDLSLLPSVKQAMMKYGFERAMRINSRFGNRFPKRSVNNQPVLALCAQSPDFRRRSDRWKMPNKYVLEERQSGDFITFQVENKEFPHHLVIGATGSGKTTLLSRMTLTALQENYRVVFIDFKGGEDERRLITGIEKYVSTPVKVVGWPGNGINLFTGTPEEIADKVIGFLPPPTGGAGDYYRSRLVTAIIAVVVRSGLKIPSSADELINRVRNGLSFCSNVQDRDFFNQKERGVPIGHDMSTSLAAYLNPLRRQGEESTCQGFTWTDDWDLAFIQLNSTREEYVRVGSAILHDFNFWVRSSERDKNPRPILLIIDEAGVLGRISGSPALADLIARARSRRVSVVLASQTLQGIGPEAEEILNTGPIRWVGKTSNPEEMTMAAGTKEVIETSYQYEEDGWKGKMSARQQETFVISPTMVRHLGTFFWSLSEGGKATWVFAPPLM
jgi:GTPase SAR1 family protein